MGHKPKSTAFLYYRSAVATHHLQHAWLGLDMKDLSGSTLGIKDERPIHLSQQGWATLVENSSVAEIQDRISNQIDILPAIRPSLEAAIFTNTPDSKQFLLLNSQKEQLLSSLVLKLFNEELTLWERPSPTQSPKPPCYINLSTILFQTPIVKLPLITPTTRPSRGYRQLARTHTLRNI